MVIKKIAEAGARVMSYRDSWIEQFTHPGLRNALIGFLGFVNEDESRRISERTKAGMDRARAAGKHIGRPAKAVYYDPEGGLHWHKSLLCPMVANSPRYRAIGYAELKRRNAPDGNPYRLCPFCRLVKKGAEAEYNTLLDEHSRLRKLLK
jgi:hypothetical protein